MKRYLKIYSRFLQYSVIKLMEYRADFFITMVHLLFFAFFNVAFYGAILANIKNIGGWNLPQMIVLVGTFMILDSIFFTFFLANFGDFDAYVRRADLDRVLTKPVDAQFYATLQKVNLRELPSLFVGISVVTYGLVMAHLLPSITAFAFYVLFCVCSLSVIYALGLIVGSITFYFEKSEDLHELIISVWQFAKLPDVYRGMIKVVFMAFLPIVFASFVPSGILFGKISIPFAVYFFVIALVFLVFSRWFFKVSLKRYKSAGG